jgi:uncharacterized caspase-like protein
MVRIRLLATLAFALLLLLPAGAGAEPRVALVIGNSAYREMPLKNPVNDARAIAAELKTLGFEVIEIEDATFHDMERAVLKFGNKLKEGGVGLFYYAGHGMQVKGQNYLVPVDAQIEEETSVRFEALAVDTITDLMGDAANRLNMIVLDACRNNPFERKLRGGGKGLAAMDAARGTFVAYATAPGSTASDGDGENGLYTEELVRALKEPGLPVESVFKRVRIGVVERSKGAQTPWESSSLTGDFYFVPPSSPAPAPRGAPSAASTGPAQTAAPRGGDEKRVQITSTAQLRSLAPVRGKSAAADAAEFACPVAGTVIETRLAEGGTGHLFFEESSGFDCRFKNRSGEPFGRYAVVANTGSPFQTQAAEEIAKLWPLKVGNAVEASFGNARRIHRVKMSVPSRERLTVPAGTFETFVIEVEDRIEDKAPDAHHGIWRYWFSPEIGYAVKRTYQNIAGPRPANNPEWWEATRITVPAG